MDEALHCSFFSPLTIRAWLRPKSQIVHKLEKTSALRHHQCRDLVEPWDEGSVADVFGMLEVAKPVVIGRESPPKAHVLVCAPSNSALDEIVIRLMDVGVMDRWYTRS